MLVALLIIAFGGALLTYLLGKISGKIRDFSAVALSLSLVVFVACLYGKSPENPYSSGFFGIPLVLRMNMLSWLFAIAVSSLGTLCTILSLSYMKGRDRTDLYYFLMLVVNAAMLGIVSAGDLVSFYIFWEIMSWSTFLLISYNKGPALAAGMKYIIMSVVGSAAFLIGALSLLTTSGTLDISQLSSAISSASNGYILFILIAFSIAFGIKNAVMPLHTWLPDSYTEAPSPFTALLSGMLTRMGVYGFLLVMYVIVGLHNAIKPRLLSYHYILAWLGAVTIVIPTFIAMLQNDAKKLLAWHGIGQGGYMILGISFGTSLGLAGGIFHTLNYAIYSVLLFMAVGAVQYRTGGERNLNSLGGLIKKMPVTFIGALLGISGLIGLPLTNGFVSKWLIYKTLIIQGSPFLAFAALVGTWGTVLSVYKFLHNVFLGQLPEKYKDIKPAPFSMQFPMIVLSAVIILLGVLPGIVLKVINAIVTSFGFDSLNVTLWGITSETGSLNTINISSALLVAAILVWMLFRAGAKSLRVPQQDTYAAGAHIPTGKYHYTAEFYGPLYRMIKPFLKDVIDEFYYRLASCLQNFANGVRRIYSGDVGNYVMYIILFLAVLIFVQLKWKLW